MGEEQDDEIDESVAVIRLPEDDPEAWRVEKQDGEFYVYGAKIEKFARRTNFDQFQSVNRLRDIMKKMGIYHQLVRDGAEGNSVVHIGDTELTLLEQ